MNILKCLVSVSVMTLISRVLGFLRDLLIAHIFGASIFTDAFFIAFKIPNLLRQIFAEGAFSKSFIPILINYKSRKDKEYIQEFIRSTSGLMILILTIIVILGIIFSNYLIIVNAPGFSKSPDKLQLACTLLKIMFPYILFISLSSLCSSILNSCNDFFIPSFSPIILNITIIVFSFFFNNYFEPSIISLAWSVIIGGFFQLFYQFPFLYKINMLVFPNINFKNIGLLKVLRKMGPSILGSGANQISLIFNTIFISLLNPGSISWMYYADRLIEFPIGIIGVSLSTILFTSFSSTYSNNTKSEYKKLLNWAIRFSLILSLPISVILFMCSKPLVIILFQYGKFTNFDVLMTQKVLELYSFGLVSFILVKILVSAFYAYQEVNIPMRISILTLFLTQLMNPFFIFYFQHSGLALSCSIASWINFILLYWKMYQKKIVNFKLNNFIFIFRLLIAISVMIFCLIVMLYFIPSWKIGSFFDKIIRLFTILLVSVIVYLITLYFLGIRVLNYSSQLFQKK
ncbi:murein biosynthesis integral membrane protein MurJ [Buchnera aphidicola]|uniref:Probable lipid II flippase MurJ n=1 Tax=Buchnera aphidicola subsp. Rhopalosiphum maidis TaxID=118109 RepID=A0A3G2I5N5_BUCRM|nr:murein biosynthesis integral membrane protein MurJ [Buchnera aphidicola]AYN24736.1 murein biosynthesis integral membrane protein MurJ [Buchnera aphidicola (Rhopalosiphum maidis)]